ncbi:MAG TPA: 30S ribosomal protein S5, partial [Candidatus Omnitrophota bacterium]|nr:30S ribosomal protein S5 [Candidatus Omnitrophota bacterium]
TGVIAGGPIRALCDAAGIKDILSKSLGSDNSVNVIKAAVVAFKSLSYKEENTRIKGEQPK